MSNVVERCGECGTELVYDRNRQVMFCPVCDPVTAATAKVKEEIEEEL